MASPGKAMSPPQKRKLESSEGPAPKRARPSSVGSCNELVLLLAKLGANNIAPRAPPSKATTYWRGIVTCHRSDNLATVFKVLTDNNILSCPVLKKEHKYYGFIDMLDIVYAVSNIFPENPSKDQMETMNFLESEVAFTSLKVTDVMKYPYSKNNPYHPVPRGYSLFHVAEIMARDGVHRVPILDANEKICNIVTQSMLLDLIADHLDTISEPLRHTTMEKLHGNGLLPQKIITMPHNAVAIQVFRQMAEKQVSAIPITRDGQLVGVLSLRDLRAIGTGGTQFWRLWDTVKTFKILAREEFKSTTPEDLIFVTKSDTLELAIRLLRNHRIHRVVVVESKQSLVPITVISQSDVLRLLIASALDADRAAMVEQE